MNRSTHKKWAIGVLGTVLFLIGTVGVINVVVDANGVFRSGLSGRFQPPNMSFWKINYLLAHKDRFDSFVFGSSRIGNIDVTRIPGGRYYNMFYPAGLPEEHLQHIRYLLDSGVRIRNILIGLDDFSFLDDPRNHLSDLDLQPHPAVSGKSWFTFYAEHFFTINRTMAHLSAFLRNARTRDRHSPYRYDLEASGRLICTDCDSNIERDVRAHVTSIKFLQPWDYRIVARDRISQAVSAIRDILRLARERSVTVIIFLNPIHKVTYLNADLMRFFKFKKALAEITPYYDFTGLNSITTNNYYFYETSHYRVMVGDMMLKVMFGIPSVSVPKDFGFRVTPENVDGHIEGQCREVLSVRKELPAANQAFDVMCEQGRFPSVNIPKTDP